MCWDKNGENVQVDYVKIKTVWSQGARNNKKNCGERQTDKSSSGTLLGVTRGQTTWRTSKSSPLGITMQRTDKFSLWWFLFNHEILQEPTKWFDRQINKDHFFLGEALKSPQTQNISKFIHRYWSSDNQTHWKCLLILIFWLQMIKSHWKCLARSWRDSYWESFKNLCMIFEHFLHDSCILFQEFYIWKYL